MDKRRVAGIAVLLLAAGAGGGYWFVSTPRLTDEMAGYELAEELGCHGCHGPFGIGGVPNPGSDEGEIPSWDGGTAMMYAETEDEIREWIMDGGPKGHTEGDSTRASADGHVHTHASTSDSNSPPLRMPAFRSVISEGELERLITYFKAIAAWDPIPEDAQRGRRAAARLGCFGCHGPAGAIGGPNPRSFKGYIPPWRGKDFAELVRNEEELESWIMDGSIPRLRSNAFARFFVKRQVVQMPAYREIMSTSELKDIMTYIRWLSQDRPGVEGSHETIVPRRA